MLLHFLRYLQPFDRPPEVEGETRRKLVADLIMQEKSVRAELAKFCRRQNGISSNESSRDVRDSEIKQNLDNIGQQGHVAGDEDGTSSTKDANNGCTANDLSRLSVASKDRKNGFSMVEKLGYFVTFDEAVGAMKNEFGIGLVKDGGARKKNVPVTKFPYRCKLYKEMKCTFRCRISKHLISDNKDKPSFCIELSKQRGAQSSHLHLP